MIARVHGPAYGAGFELALDSDFRIVSDEAALAFPVNQLALLWGMAQLPRLVGVAKAKEILMLHHTLTGTEAHELGLATEVVPLNDLEERTMAMAQQLARGPRRTYAGIKKGLVEPRLEALPGIRAPGLRARDERLVVRGCRGGSSGLP